MAANSQCASIRNWQVPTWVVPTLKNYYHGFTARTEICGWRRNKHTGRDLIVQIENDLKQNLHHQEMCRLLIMSKSVRVAVSGCCVR